MDSRLIWVQEPTNQGEYMLNFILGFFAGALVVDFLWASKMGLVQLFIARFKSWRANRNAK